MPNRSISPCRDVAPEEHERGGTERHPSDQTPAAREGSAVGEQEEQEDEQQFGEEEGVVVGERREGPSRKRSGVSLEGVARIAEREVRDRPLERDPRQHPPDRIAGTSGRDQTADGRPGQEGDPGEHIARKAGGLILWRSGHELERETDGLEDHVEDRERDRQPPGRSYRHVPISRILDEPSPDGRTLGLGA